MFIIAVIAIGFSSCSKDSVEPSSSTSNGCASVQCSATASSTGQRCQNMTTNCNGRCYAHQ